jgi:hypothetical protein
MDHRLLKGSRTRVGRIERDSGENNPEDGIDTAEEYDVRRHRPEVIESPRESLLQIIHYDGAYLVKPTART